MKPEGVPGASPYSAIRAALSMRKIGWSGAIPASSSAGESGPTPLKLPDFPLPAAKVLAQDRLFLGVRDLSRPELLPSPPEQQVPPAAHA